MGPVLAMSHFTGEVRMKKNKLVFMGMLLLCFVFMQSAKLVATPNLEITVDTDKDIYLLGEDMIVSVIALNLDDTPIQLGFPSTLQASYLFDGIFDWTQGKLFFDTPTTVTINANDTYTWNLAYGTEEKYLYPLAIGYHEVVGEIVGYGESNPVAFQVIPEPATFVILSVGWLLLRKRSL